MPMEKYKPEQIVGVLRQIDLPPVVGPLFMLVHTPFDGPRISVPRSG